jgi:soluble lytic murein transglycosylase
VPSSPPAMPSAPAIATNWSAAAAQLGNHELAPYVENYQLRMNMDQGDSPLRLRDFFERYDKSYVAEKLRADWIRWLGKRSMWSEIDAEYPEADRPEPDVTCYSQQARLARDDRTVLDDAEKLWLTMLEPPEACRRCLSADRQPARVHGRRCLGAGAASSKPIAPGWAKTTLNYLPPSQMPMPGARHA